MDDDRGADRALTSSETRLAEQVPLLLLHDISKKFGKVTALSHVSFAARPGRVTALLGENGAGKTTLMRIAFGLIQPDDGQISVAGVPQRFRFPADAIDVGVGMVHQQFSLVSAMTVAENVALGGSGRYSLRSVAEALREVADRSGLYLDPSRRVAELSNAERQKLEIIRTFARNARILILDEPTSVLTPNDRIELFREIAAFARAGNAVVLITHKLRDALDHSDEIVVLRQGRVALAAPSQSLDEASLTAAMLGGASAQVPPSTEPAEKRQEQIAELRRVVLRSASTGPRGAIDIRVGAGEIIGIAALEGGAAEFLRVLARRSSPVAGDVMVPRQVGFVPENRRDDALIGDFNLIENFALVGAGARTGLVNWKMLELEASAILEKYRVKAASLRVRPFELSGGNQQRFVIGRELYRNPSLIVLENPTQGLDVSAAAFVHEQAREARQHGAAIVFYSSDLDELAAISDRVLVLTADGIQEVLPNRDAIGSALLGTGSLE